MESDNSNSNVPLTTVSTIYDSMSREQLIVVVLLLCNLEITPKSEGGKQKPETSVWQTKGNDRVS